LFSGLIGSRNISRALGAVALATQFACAGDAKPAAANAQQAPTTRAATAATAAISLTDDGGHVVTLARPAQRVISLIPSGTETLIAIGATDRIVGRTRYDVAHEVASVPSVGGGVDPSVEAIVALHPDLVVSWDNDKRQVVRQRLVALGVPVFVMRTEDTTDVFRGIENLGRLTGRDSAAHAVSASLRAQLDTIQRSVADKPAPSVLYVVYDDPPMTTGPMTFIGQLISLAGGRSVFADATTRWPTVAMEEIVRRNPDLVVVPEGEFKTNSIERFRKMAGWRTLRAVRDGHVVTVPANLLSRPSPNIAQAARVLRAALHPEFASTP